MSTFSNLTELVGLLLNRQADWFKERYGSELYLLLQHPKPTDQEQRNQKDGVRIRIAQLGRSMGPGPIVLTVQYYWHGQPEGKNWKKGHWASMYTEGQTLEWSSEDNRLTHEGRSALHRLWGAVQVREEGESTAAAANVLADLL